MCCELITCDPRTGLDRPIIIVALKKKKSPPFNYVSSGALAWNNLVCYGAWIVVGAASTVFFCSGISREGWVRWLEWMNVGAS